MPAEGIDWSQGWPSVEAVIRRTIATLEAGTPLHFTTEEYINNYRLIYDMCVQHRPREYADALYGSYKGSIEGYAASSVLPTLIGKHGESLLREFVKGWFNHGELVKWLSRFFQYLDRFYLVKRKLPALAVTGQFIFLNVVYEKVRYEVQFATLSMIHQEREGSLIDGQLLKNALDIYVSMGAGSMKFYEQDFEKPMLSDTAVYYSQKAEKWILACCFSDYTHKANECMKQEEARAVRYFQSCSKQKLLEVVYHELFVVHARQLEEKGQSDSCASKKVINQWLAERCERLSL